MIQLCLSWLINEGTEREQRGNREEAMNRKTRSAHSIHNQSQPMRSMKSVKSVKEQRGTVKNKGNSEYHDLNYVSSHSLLLLSNVLCAKQNRFAYGE